MKKWISNGAEHSFHIQLINIYEMNTFESVDKS